MDQTRDDSLQQHRVAGMPWITHFAASTMRHSQLKKMPEDLQSALNCCQSCTISRGRINDLTTVVRSGLKRANVTSSFFLQSEVRWTPGKDCAHRTLWTPLSGGDVFTWAGVFPRHIFLMLQYAGLKKKRGSCANMISFMNSINVKLQRHSDFFFGIPSQTN